MNSALTLEIEAARNLSYGRSFSSAKQADGSLRITFADGSPGPSAELLAAEVERIKAGRETLAYRAQRAGEYPPLGDQLDDLYKRGAFSPEMTARIKAVKDKYPKPSSV